MSVRRTGHQKPHRPWRPQPGRRPSSEVGGGSSAFRESGTTPKGKVGYTKESAHDAASLGRTTRPSSAERSRRPPRFVRVVCPLLAAYIAVDAVLALWRRDRPSPSIIGIGLTAVSRVAMVWLARAKRRDDNREGRGQTRRRAVRTAARSRSRARQAHLT